MISGLALSQRTIEGFVFDSSTGDPIKGVNILVEGVGAGTSTDERGRFSLLIEVPEITLFVNHIAYESTDFAIIYVPTEGLFSELSSYRDPKTKELLLQELRTKYKVTVSGPNTLSALLQSYQLGFQTLKVQQHATQIYSDLRNISTRFEKHFEGIKELRKKLEQAISVTDGFGRDARSIMNTLGNIKDPQQVTDSLKENPEKIKVLK